MAEERRAPGPPGEVRVDNDALRSGHADARSTGRGHPNVERVRFHTAAGQPVGQRIGSRACEDNRLARFVNYVGDHDLGDVGRRERRSSHTGNRYVAGQRNVGAVVGKYRRFVVRIQIDREDAPVERRGRQ